MSAQGTSTVVSVGSLIAENGSPSKPIMEISCGTRMPRSCMARMAPSAMLALLARKAVGSAIPRSSASPNDLRAPSIVGNTRQIRSSEYESPGWCIAASKASRRALSLLEGMEL